MGRPILRLATRLGRRTRWTAWAIAFACMVLVGSLNLVDGLGAGVDSVTSRFAAGTTVYLRGNDLLASAIDPSALTVLPGDYAVLRVHVGTLSVPGLSREIVVASLTTYHAGTATTPFPASAADLSIDTGLRQELQAATSQPLGSTANLSLFGLASTPLAIAAAPASHPAVLPDTWAWVRPEFLRGLSPSQGGSVQALIAPEPLDAAVAARLGVSPLQTVGAVGFTVASIAEARSVLVGLGLVLATVIGLLAYSAIGLEVYLRHEEIATLRSLGAGPATVAVVYTGKGVALALLGATLGSALGVVLAHAFVSFAPLLGFPNLILLPLPLVPIALAFGLAVTAAFLGGLAPTWRAVRQLRTAPGASPF